MIAQINDDVITLSMLKRETKERIETLKQAGMSEQEATEEVAKRQAELIAHWSTKRCCCKKGRSWSCQTKLKLRSTGACSKLQKSRASPPLKSLKQRCAKVASIRWRLAQTLRTEIMKQAVIQQEVDRKLFFG